MHSINTRSWEGELIDLGRLVLGNEENFRAVQTVFIKPVLDTVLQSLQKTEPKIIDELSNNLDSIERTFPNRRIMIALNLRGWQRSLATSLGYLQNEKDQVWLELSFTRFHQFRFARGPHDLSELADFVLHTQYTEGRKAFGLSNFFQIKRIADETCSVSLDPKQIRFWACPTPRISYYEWDPANAMDTSSYSTYGECSHYWFVHSCREANALLASALMVNADSWIKLERPQVSFRTSLGSRLWIPLASAQQHATHLQEVAALLHSSCLTSASVEELLVSEGLNDLCKRRASTLPEKTIYLLRERMLTAPLLPAGLRFIDSILLRHGSEERFLNDILEISRNLGPAKQAKKSGLAVTLRVRFGGQYGDKPPPRPND